MQGFWKRKCTMGRVMDRLEGARWDVLDVFVDFGGTVVWYMVSRRDGGG